MAKHRWFRTVTPQGNEIDIKGDPNMDARTLEALQNMADATFRHVMEKKIGSRVVMAGTHPWRTHAGTFVRLEQTPWGEKAVIKLDNGVECFAMQIDDAKWLEE